MKRILLTTVFSLAAALAAPAADVVITFGTKGPDSYQDGTAALSNELYAVVWVENGYDFAGMNADASLKDAVHNKLIAAIPTTKAGYLAPTTHQVTQAEALALVDGVFYIVLLDTRNADGTVDPCDASGTRPLKAVNGYKAVANTPYLVSDLAAIYKIKSSVVVNTVSGIPAGCPVPVITSIERMADGRVRMKVKGTAAYLRYKAAGVDLASGQRSDVSGAAPFNGLGSAEDEVELVVPAAESRGFFQVIRK